MNDYDISSIFKDMEDHLISSMSRNMKRHTNWETEEDFQWDMWQAKQMDSLNEYRKQNSKFVKKQSTYIRLKLDELLKQSNEHGMMEEEIKILEAIKKGYKPGRTPKGIESSFFKVNDRKLNSLIKSIDSDVSKASTAMLRMANDEYRKTIFKAQVFANTGTATVDQCIDMATKDFLAKGINCIEYSDGKRVNIASYAEMAIKTANKRAFLMGEGSKRDEWGIHTVLISSYGACSPICLPLQGKVYIDDVFSGGTAEESEKTGYPLLSNAIAQGLFHPNCKHTMSTYFEGISKKPVKADIAKTSENSNIIATQRYNERNIRMYKRLQEGSIDETNKAKYASKVKEWQIRNNELVKMHPEMHRNYKRESLRGVNSVNTTSDELQELLESDGLSIPKFVNNGQILKPIVHNTPEEVNEYMKLMNLKTNNEKILDVIRNDIKLMPKRDLDLLKQFKLEIGEQKEGTSHYRKSKRRFLPIKNCINIKENARQGAFAHEFAHFASDKISLYQDDNFLSVLENAVRDSELSYIDVKETRYVRVKSTKFVRGYQGRTYINYDDFIKSGNKLELSDLKEYVSVGYETYIVDPVMLYQYDEMLYDYFEREGIINATKNKRD